MTQPMEVEVWQGDWGLPSIDIECLQIMTYGKFSGSPIQTRIKNNPFRRTLPTFRHGTTTCYKLQDVINYLRTRNIDADHSLNTKQLSEVQAYGQMLREKLYPGLQFILWVDSQNHVNLTRPWFAKVLPFPFSYYYLGSFEANAKNLITAIYGELEDNLPNIETQVYSDAEKCITLLSNRLGDSNYFFGNQPTSMDAIVFSYLAPLLKIPFPHAALQNHLKACTNLVTFISRISQKYYPTLSQEYDKQQRHETEVKKEEDFPHKRRNQLVAGLVAVGAMTGYALSSGLLQVSLEVDDDSQDVMMLEEPLDEDSDE